MTSTLWQPSAERIAQANLTAFARARRAQARASTLPDYAALWRWSIDHREEFWREVWDVRRRDRRAAASARWSTATGCRARAGFPTRGSTSPRTCSRAARRRRRAMRSCSGARTRSQRRVSHAELHAAVVARGAGAARRTGVERRRPRRGLPAQHAGDDRRDARRGEPRRDLVVVLAGFRRAGRARPLRPDRAARCSSPSTATGTTARRMPILDKVAEIVARLPTRRARRRRAVSAATSGGPQATSRTVRSARRVGRFRRAVRRRADRLRAAAVRSSALHPVFVGHDRRAEVHRARRRRHAAAAPEGASCCTATSSPATACSTSRPAAG